MGVYTRYKRGPGGFRQIVALLEGTPAVRRARMIEVGMAEDPDYTKKVLKFLLTFDDLIQLPELELAELMYKAPPRSIALALKGLPPEIQERFMRCCKPKVAAEVRDFQEMESSLAEVGGARLKLIQVARELEKNGLIHTKRISE